MGLDEVADVVGLADEAGAPEVEDLLGDAVLDDEPGVGTGHHCLLLLVGVGYYVEGC